MMTSEHLLSIISFPNLIDTTLIPSIDFISDDPLFENLILLDSYWEDDDQFIQVFEFNGSGEDQFNIDVQIDQVWDPIGNEMDLSEVENIFVIDLTDPLLISTEPSSETINDDLVGEEMFSITFTFSEAMNTDEAPSVSFPMEDASLTLMLNEGTSYWSDDMTFVAVYDVMDADETIDMVDTDVSGVSDTADNMIEDGGAEDIFDIDTENPMVTSYDSNDWITDADADFSIDVVFNEMMDDMVDPMISFPNEDPLANTLTSTGGSWSGNTYTATFDVTDAGEELFDIDVQSVMAQDANGNVQMMDVTADEFSIDTKNPQVLTISANTYLVHDGTSEFELVIIFDEDMTEGDDLTISFPVEDPAAISDYTLNWINSTTVEVTYTVDVSSVEDLEDIDVLVQGGLDAQGNPLEDAEFVDYFSIAITTVGLDENDLFGEAKLYPNPVTGGMDVIVEFKSLLNNVQYRIYDQNGRLNAESITIQQANQINVSTIDLAEGMYFMHISSEDANRVFKFEVAK